MSLASHHHHGAPVFERSSLLRRWAERIFAWRDRVLGSPVNQRRLAGFPMTRGVARARARRLFDIAAGFVYSQTLLACVRADWFEALAGGPLDLEELALEGGFNRAAAWRLAEAAVSLDLLARRGRDRYGLGELGAALRGNPGLAAMIEHNAVFYEDLADPTALLKRARPTRLSAFWAYEDAAAAGEDAEDRAGAADAYSDLMGASQGFIAEDVLDARALEGAKTLLDIGGGDGVFLGAALRRHPGLSGAVFDLPDVAVRARARFAASDLAGRADAFGGDARREPPDFAPDAVSLVRVLHDHDDEDARAILRTAARALAPGGRLVIAEPMAGTPGAAPMGSAYFGLYLWAMGRGRARTADELSELAREAGFERLRLLKTRRPLLVRVMTGIRSSQSVKKN